MATHRPICEFTVGSTRRYTSSPPSTRTWRAELRRELPYGQFGENLTVSGLIDDTVQFGDVLAVGGALLLVTQPR